VAPVTRSIRIISSHVQVGPTDGLRRESAINLDDIQTVPASRIERRITTLSLERMAQVDRAIKFALALT
jgi:mRNA-degrading endonuclease toxin of MazEF toxin-antitoxin module